ncbi:MULTISPECIES: NAD(P)-dependent oxidoreductase [unclassified Mycolicibacterium]|uniref:NAD-dependent epimerase/dehydratase family protein n=1 Tax=unclassified Mycolicibacterium TaxID=2636767 RepID=UPI0012DE8A71|nr:MULTISPECIES: NAD(P)-dependent oxidoreductase [unclassified Mycolicibacterium]MUL85122.1 NAD(P)-dependent oxidoreductase [Mycolicibacterium sp. CBMA 329]MUL91089.1 NAD(P)-dependent oxidoreductase [Mycolicibacterium sp. CBMA 331]MUL98240.1 NAD(P)-dependent oxidoreductase [Mycolicibacterium sp. CBMA 334]MUM26119.1 NAD(P)-dependent oxidoreductase [Mycolicibacterium sp. CBMA 295]MUM40848.1 NAD(P)-dependent oxidoreductase [Mycolicibacterium sp. CBMA 247]
MSDAVLVTGAFGLVGSTVVTTLAAGGHMVVATDLDVPANRKAAAALPASVQVRWADLTDSAAVDALVAAVAPAAIIHLAAIIPPFCYMRRGLARKVNVEATASLLRAAEAQPTPPRFIQASSVAVYGARNPHHIDDVLTPDTPTNPSDIYGAHKVEAEGLVRASALDWLILRLGGVMSSQFSLDMDVDLISFESVLPADGRLQTVDVRDVAAAFVAATTVPTETANHEVLLIGGEPETHRHTQSAVGSQAAAAMGIKGGLPIGRPGNPDDDTVWFATDWMDTSRSQEVLGFQQHSWPQLLADTRANAGLKRFPIGLAAPLIRGFLRSKSAYKDYPGQYADVWNAIAKKWGDPGPDQADERSREEKK